MYAIYLFSYLSNCHVFSRIVVSVSFVKIANFSVQCEYNYVIMKSKKGIMSR